jgi:CYTH domain-containing protein
VGLEIERRFLVIGQGWRRHVRWQGELRQGYLTSTPGGFTVRVRLSHEAAGAELEPAKASGVRAWLTLKAPAPALDPAPAAEPQSGSGLVRQEFEYPIPAADAAALLALTARQLSKRRHGLDLPGGDWVVDVFEGTNAPLVVAEVELDRPDQPVAVPDWCGLELTGRHELSNAALAHEPFASWPAERREPLLQALGSRLKIS